MADTEHDFAAIEDLLRKTETIQENERNFFEGIASLIAYQYNLCSKFVAPATDLIKQIHKLEERNKVPQIKFPNDSTSISKTSRFIELEQALTKEIWQVISPNEDAIESFQLSHDAFYNILHRRNEAFSHHIESFPIISDAEYLDETIKEEKQEQLDDIKNFLKKIESKLTCQISSNENIKGFKPTYEIIQEIDANLNGNFSENNINKYYEELKRTEKELSQSLIDATNIYNEYMENSNFPSSDILHNLPQYQELMASLSYSSVIARNNLLVHSRKIRDLIERFKETQEKFNECFVLPKIDFHEKEMVLQNDIRSYVSHRKILFLQNLLKKPGFGKPSDKPPEWNSLEFSKSEAEFLRTLHNLLTDERYEECLQLLEMSFERYTNSKEDIQNEIKQIELCHENAEKSREEMFKHTVPHINDKMETQVMEKRQENETLYNEIRMELDAMNNDLLTTINNTNEILNSITFESIFPHQFEQLMNGLIDKEPKKDLLRKKIENVKEEIDEKQNNNNKIRKEIENMKYKLNEKQKQFEESKLRAEKNPKKYNESNVENDSEDEEFNDLKEKYYCVCHENPRDTVILKCGHTFCSKCMKERIKARNRKCGHCGQSFDPNSEVSPIRWN
ncbi:E3 ubiquitin-protein ligase BRE1 [Histomonas meleagridis]|uniref:E3 ubiquitin-protein ligase BRE1 n=1 Tax=Histomonas meleagridis TaxID=135588 RepID=UPI00355A8E57|nr:E3 ubiquitin-protein ligase BRE1 [Histomonas meleagridis]KAH0805329.1 E3 ubiquitin-protein ligase BRE1 [Histomonas meleagridis]